MRGPAAITGIAVLSPAGIGEEALWRALAGGEDRRERWPKRALAGYPVDNVVPIPESLWTGAGIPAAGSGNRAAGLAGFAVGRALAQAGLAGREGPGDGGLRVGCFLSTTTAGVEVAEDDVLGLRPVPAASDLDGSAVVPALPWTGPTGVVSTACSSGLVAPALAIDVLAAGEADVMVAGGLDVLLEYTICGFNALRLATADRCRPFAEGRRGVLLSEGVACVCLEPLEAALARGAGVRAVVTGYGIGCDADHVTAPNPAGVARAVAAALEMGGTAPGAIGGIFAHATGTRVNDAAEVAALRAAFGTDALPPVTAIKSVMGHPQAGAGAMALVAAVLALENGWLPPTAGMDGPDPALGGVDVVTGAGRALAKRHLMVDAFGFGGNNCVMTVAGRPTGGS
jgi:3-oxoacyl-[acyl-carrier-protein] synthase II